MNILDHNRQAWNQQSIEGSEWTTPVSSEQVREAKQGNWNIILTPNKNVPKEWFGHINSKKILCLASGGGQQAPILAAAGAEVISFDLSEEQLNKDQLVSDRDQLNIICEQGDMADLSRFADNDFDLIFHPVSNVFSPNIQSVWSECYRVLKPGGRLLAGFMNPSFFLFDHDKKTLVAKYKLPYSEPGSLSKEDQEELFRDKERALEFSHSLEAQIGGQLKTGFLLKALYEDDWNDEATPLNKFSPTSLATLAVKPEL